MSLTTVFRQGKILRTVLPRTSQCWYTTDQGGDAGAPAEPPVTPAAPKAAASSPPEPFDNTQYKSADYFQHDTFSFYDFENVMMQSRVGQPSSVSHYNKLPQDVLAELEKSAKR